MSHHESLGLEWQTVLDYAKALPSVEVSQPFPTGVLNFVRASKSVWGDTSSGLHPAPRRQIVIVLGGEALIVTGDGGFTVRPGDAYLLEDTNGSGHEATLTGSKDYLAVVVTIPH